MGMEVRVLCGAPCGKQPVFDQFYDAFSMLEVPEGSAKSRVTGGSVPLNLNKLVDVAIDGDFSHIFIVEDDSTFAPDTLLRLLQHDKPVVAGLCRSRQAPFKPYIYSDLDNVEGLRWRPLTPDDKGLIRVAATGMGGILIRTAVFKQLKRPYFHSYFKGETMWGQDVVFGKALIEAGIEVYCDLDVIIWHATQCVIGTEWLDGKWATVFKVNEATLKANS